MDQRSRDYGVRDSESNPDFRKITRSLSLTFAVFGDTGTEDRPRWLNFDGRNPQMAQRRWQWLRSVGTGQIPRTYYVSEIRSQSDRQEMAAEAFAAAV